MAETPVIPANVDNCLLYCASAPDGKSKVFELCLKNMCPGPIVESSVLAYPDGGKIVIESRLCSGVTIEEKVGVSTRLRDRYQLRDGSFVQVTERKLYSQDELRERSKLDIEEVDI